MKAMRFSVLIAIFIFCHVAMAQGYSIRVEFNTNLRAGYSLESAVVESAPAGSILQVIDSYNRWLKINRNGRELWMASWVGHRRVTQSSQAPAAAEVDNCCYVDRQCHSNKDWIDGYWAYQRNQCPVGAPAGQESAVQPTVSTAASVDNCCFVDRQCNSDQEWQDGYWAYQNNQCPSGATAGQESSVQPVSSATAAVDNCCFVDRQCNSDQEWQDGYWAYQNNQCGAPVGGAAGRADNCCSLGWDCHSDVDFNDGYWTFRHNICYHTQYRVSQVARNLNATPQTMRSFGLGRDTSRPFDNCCYMNYATCHTPDQWAQGGHQYRANQCVHPAPLGTRPEIEGNRSFVDLINKTLELMQNRAPAWLQYLYNSGVRKIQMSPNGGGAGFLNRQWIVDISYRHSDNPDAAPSMGDIVDAASSLIHEACHSAQQRAYTQSAIGWQNELPCVEAQYALLNLIAPYQNHYGYLAIIRNIGNPETWWWTY